MFTAEAILPRRSTPEAILLPSSEEIDSNMVCILSSTAERSARGINFTACSFSNRVRVKWMRAPGEGEWKWTALPPLSFCELAVGGLKRETLKGGWLVSHQMIWGLIFSEAALLPVTTRRFLKAHTNQHPGEPLSLSIYFLLGTAGAHKQGLAVINYLSQCHHVTRNWLKKQLFTCVYFQRQTLSH